VRSAVTLSAERGEDGEEEAQADETEYGTNDGCGFGSISPEQAADTDHSPEQAEKRAAGPAHKQWRGSAPTTCGLCRKPTSAHSPIPNTNAAEAMPSPRLALPSVFGC